MPKIYPDKNLLISRTSVNWMPADLTFFFLIVSGDGQVDFNEFMTILGPKLLSSETREGFLGSTIDTIFWQVKHPSL